MGTVTRGLEHLEEGRLIGYHPVGEDNVRQVGIVEEVEESGVVVTMTDDPYIEERVPFDRIEAIEPLGLVLDVMHPEGGDVGSVEISTSYPHDQLLHRVDVEESFSFDITAALDELGYEIVPK